MTAAEIIRALGGATVLAEALGKNRSAVSMWAIDGIPGRHWPAIARFAQGDEKTAHITLDVLEAHRIAREAAA